MKRKKDFRTGIEKLNELMSVCEDKSIMEVEASEVIDALASVRAEIFLYVQHWANKEGKKDTHPNKVCFIDLDEFCVKRTLKVIRENQIIDKN